MNLENLRNLKEIHQNPQGFTNLLSPPPPPLHPPSSSFPASLSLPSFPPTHPPYGFLPSYPFPTSTAAPAVASSLNKKINKEGRSQLLTPNYPPSSSSSSSTTTSSQPNFNFNFNSSNSLTPQPLALLRQAGRVKTSSQNILFNNNDGNGNSIDENNNGGRLGTLASVAVALAAATAAAAATNSTTGGMTIIGNNRDLKSTSEDRGSKTTKTITSSTTTTAIASATTAPNGRFPLPSQNPSPSSYYHTDNSQSDIFPKTHATATAARASFSYYPPSRLSNELPRPTPNTNEIKAHSLFPMEGVSGRRDEGGNEEREEKRGRIVDLQQHHHQFPISSDPEGLYSHFIRLTKPSKKGQSRFRCVTCGHEFESSGRKRPIQHIIGYSFKPGLMKSVKTCLKPFQPLKDNLMKMFPLPSENNMVSKKRWIHMNNDNAFPSSSNNNIIFSIISSSKSDNQNINSNNVSSNDPPTKKRGREEHLRSSSPSPPSPVSHFPTLRSRSPSPVVNPVLARSATPPASPPSPRSLHSSPLPNEVLSQPPPIKTIVSDENDEDEEKRINPEGSPSSPLLPSMTSQKDLVVALEKDKNPEISQPKPVLTQPSFKPPSFSHSFPVPVPVPTHQNSMSEFKYSAEGNHEDLHIWKKRIISSEEFPKDNFSNNEKLRSHPRPTYLPPSLMSHSSMIPPVSPHLANCGYRYPYGYAPSCPVPGLNFPFSQKHEVPLPFEPTILVQPRNALLHSASTNIVGRNLPPSNTRTPQNSEKSEAAQEILRVFANSKILSFMKTYNLPLQALDDPNLQEFMKIIRVTDSEYLPNSELIIEDLASAISSSTAPSLHGDEKLFP